MEAQIFKRSYFPNEVEFWHSVKIFDTPKMRTLSLAWHEKIIPEPTIALISMFEFLIQFLHYHKALENPN